MNEEGIYRIGGMKTSIDNICGLFEERGDSDNPIDLSGELDINAITGCLKAFFRKVSFAVIPLFFLFSFGKHKSHDSPNGQLPQLPEPLVPYQLYAPLIAMASHSNPSIVAFSGLLGDFPSKNFEILKVLIEHLK